MFGWALKRAQKMRGAGGQSLPSRVGERPFPDGTVDDFCLRFQRCARTPTPLCRYAYAADTSFNLALFKWSLRSLVEIATDVLPGCCSDAEVAQWRSTLQLITPYHVDPATGSLMIGAGLPFAHANKHFSHLFSIFPLGLLQWSAAADRELWTKSIGLFAKLNNPRPIAEEFAFLGMALITAAAVPGLPGGAPAGWADYVLGNISDHFFKVPQLGAGTLYADCSSCGPVAGCRNGMASACNESPIMASTATQQMLMQSWNSRPVSIFPATPATWANASFAQMRAERAVLVSAHRISGVTAWIYLNATVGGTVRVHSSITDLVAAAGSPATVRPVPATPPAPGVYTVAGGRAPWSVLLYSNARGPPTAADLVVSPQPGGAPKLWGSRPMPAPPLPPSPPPSPPPPPAPLPPLPPCPADGCVGCGGCKWPYLNPSEPTPSRPFQSDLTDVTVRDCEVKCAAQTGCVGFTFRTPDCWLYSHVSGKFDHRPG